MGYKTILSLQPYCQGCPAFEPDVHKPVIAYGSKLGLCDDIVIMCANATMCDAIRCHLIETPETLGEIT